MKIVSLTTACLASRLRHWLSNAVVTLLAVLMADTAAAQPPEPRPLRVLFLGNSYTFSNDMPDMLAAMAARDGELSGIETGWFAVGSANLALLWESDISHNRIRHEGWDIVVLQEGSNRSWRDPAAFDHYAPLFRDEIADAGAQPLLFMTWHHLDKDWMFDANMDLYRQVSQDHGMPVAPVGLAWKALLDADGSISLHMADGTHPNRLGSLLTACVFFKVLTDSDRHCPAPADPEVAPANWAQIEQAATRAVRESPFPAR
jgi:hypothetical protein